jgi:hypothetical protein
VSAKLVFRNAVEFAVLYLLWFAGLTAIDRQAASPGALLAGVMAVAFAKTAFFGVENIRQLKRASDENWAYHRFILLLLVNMLQIVASFGLDYHLLHHLHPPSFAVLAESLAGAELVFEFFYFSALNFMFFGYGDITPQTVPAKLLTLTEIALAFVTVIFLLSDFIALKESLRKPPT